ncbi:MAG: cytochrome c3 family protein [Desulfobulbaceae bacterium]|nr:cytochrome c3 family protein [Desulfobulbaceae bacterium]
MRGELKKLCGVAVLLLMAGIPVQWGYAQPDTVELGSLAQYYEPVQFDHVMHVDMLGDNSCAYCHHHTVGTQLVNETCMRCHENGGETDSASCRDCHPATRFSAEYLGEIENNIYLFHVDKPGLKGAFHQKCMGCHTEMDAAIGCEDCHVRTDSGDKLYRSGTYAPVPAEAMARH